MFQSKYGSRVAAVAAASFIVLVSAIPAQAQLELAAGGGIGNFSGDDFQGSKVGPTFGGELRFSLGPLAHIGLGVDYSIYGIQDFPEDLKQIDVFASVRRYTDAPAMRFYFGGKAGYVRQSSDASELMTGSSVANGFAIGPIVGVRVPLGDVALEGGVDVLYHAHGSFSAGGTEIEGSSASGFRWITRVGLAIPLGG